MHNITLQDLQKIDQRGLDHAAVLALFDKTDKEAEAIFAQHDHKHTPDSRDAIADCFAENFIDQPSPFWRTISVICNRANNSPNDIEDECINVAVRIGWRTGDVSKFFCTYHHDE